jgi:histidinol dehydrogenase
MDKFGAAIVCRDLPEACEIVNLIAPEHLSIAVADTDLALDKIVNAGCILVGEWTPESAGDFCAGPSHTLPTARAARFGSPVNVMDFLKFQSVLNLNRSSFEELASTIEAFGEMEGFPAHADGAKVRNLGGD